MLLEPKQFLKTGGEIALFFEIDFSKFLKTFKPKELGNFLESFLSYGQKLVENSFNFFDEVYFGVFAVVESFDFPVEEIVFFLFGLKQGLNTLNIFCSPWSCKRFKVVLDFVQLLADFLDFQVLFLELNLVKKIRFCQWI